MGIKPLQKINFLGADHKPIDGLVPVREVDFAKSKLPLNEKAAIWDLCTKARNNHENPFNYIDYIFFRQFSDGRSSQIAAYVVDNTENQHDKSELQELHKQVWLQGKAPLLYIAWPSRVDILSCARGADFWDDYKGQLRYEPVKQLEIAGIISEELQKYSAYRLADGTFWDDPDNSKLANYDKAAHQSLIQAVVETDTELDGENHPLLRRLLVLFILIKYLEDRGVFPGNRCFGQFHKGAKSFLDVVKGEEPDEVYKLLKHLQEEKFNGDVFDLSGVSGISKEKLTKPNLRTFANFIEAKTKGNQRYLWEHYSFEHLPVEIISHLYQRFVKGHGAVYTPHFLAELLLDYTMPYKTLTGNERILDPACGSGVFLVGAFKRLIQHWRSQNDWQRPDVKTLKEMLANSIFGVDLDTNAIDLTAFSLSLAICDALKPEIIWNELKFDKLRVRNLVHNDFFRVLLDSKAGLSTILDKPFDIIIGNPPFESELTKEAKQIDDQETGENGRRPKCPDKQVAYLFLEQALTSLKRSGALCLIQPSGFLYNRKVDKFRTYFFEKYHVSRIFDFTSIRKLYEGADPKTIAINAKPNKPETNNEIQHLTFRRTVSVKGRICFELDHYDYHIVSREQAVIDPYVWRINLLGGGRLHGISQRFRNIQTLAQYIENRRWEYGEGFIAAKTGRREPAPFLTGKPLLPTKAFTRVGIDKTQIDSVKETHFRSAYTKERYSAPLLLIKESDYLPIGYIDKGFLAYRNEIVGIHAPMTEASDLLVMNDLLHSRHDILCFSVLMHGARSFISKSTSILKSDIDNLPFPEESERIGLSFWEQALKDDVLGYMADFIRLGQNSELLKKSANKEQLGSYADMFVRMLGSVYGNLKASKPRFLNGLICQPFYFGDEPELPWINKDEVPHLEKVIYQQQFRQLRTVRVVRYYDKNVILIIKPDRLRYWIRSTAIRDADETLMDLREQGY